MRIKQILETTAAGSVATVAQPMMTQTRENVNVPGLKPVKQLMKGKPNKKGPYANSIVENKVTEDDLAEQDLIVIPGQGRLRRTGFVKHDLDQGEHEGHTLKNSLHTIARAASELDERLSTQSEFPEWVSEKIGAAKGMMVSVMDYLVSSQEMQHDRDAMESAGVIAGGLAYEDSDGGEQIPQMAMGELRNIAKNCKQIHQMLKQGNQLDAWEYSYITVSNDHIGTVADVLATDSAEDVTEGVAETLPISDAVKVLRQYGADHFKTTSNELHFYKNGKPLSIDLIFNDDATRSVSLSQLNSATRSLKGQDLAEGSQRVDSIVTDALRVMKGPEVSDAVLALKRVLGDRAYNERRGFYSFYIDQIHDMYNQQNINELSSGLLGRAAQAATDKRNQAMEPKLHDALGGGYMNPLATHYDNVSQKMDNRAGQVRKKETIQNIASKIASPAVMRKMGMSGVAEGKIDFAKKLQGKVNNHNKAVVKTKQAVGSRVADIGAGGKEYNVKTDAAWDAAKKKVSEGAKVDRMVKHVEKSEEKAGKSKKDAKNISWATANKRGMLDNKNKKA